MSMSIYLTNLGKYNEGYLIGKWVKLPVAADKLDEVLEEIGINEEYEEYCKTKSITESFFSRKQLLLITLPTKEWITRGKRICFVLKKTIRLSFLRKCGLLQRQSVSKNLLLLLAMTQTEKSMLQNMLSLES